MSKKIVFCENCRKEVPYKLKKVCMTATLKEDKYNYYGIKAYCIDCGKQLYIPEINDLNLKALYDIYRQKNDIISLDAILSIPEKYKIEKRSLSLLLGWEEQTFSRYCEGDIPTKEHSDILTKIYNNPEYYAEILKKD